MDGDHLPPLPPRKERCRRHQQTGGVMIAKLVLFYKYVLFGIASGILLCVIGSVAILLLLTFLEYRENKGKYGTRV
jgi:hypothetical protein